MALRSLARVLPKWYAWSTRASEQEILTNSAYPWPSKTPKYVGSIVQNYRTRARDGKEAAPTRAYQKWFDALLTVKTDILLPSLASSGLLLAQKTYVDAQSPPNEFLVEVPDFNSLIAISQQISKPVFSLTKDDIKNSGSVAQNQLESVLSFETIYRVAAEKISAILT
jgi:hypothetical protein